MVGDLRGGAEEVRGVFVQSDGGEAVFAGLVEKRPAQTATDVSQFVPPGQGQHQVEGAQPLAGRGRVGNIAVNDRDVHHHLFCQSRDR